MFPAAMRNYALSDLEDYALLMVVSVYCGYRARYGGLCLFALSWKLICMIFFSLSLFPFQYRLPLFCLTFRHETNGCFEHS